ncbi:hypothetical protein BVRB_032240, partial [Beta vulgaris subsp. vulgaris]
MAHQPLRRRNKKKTKRRAKPYSEKNDADGFDIEMNALDMDRVETLGKMKQRHKREQRQLRDQIAGITEELKRLSKKKAGEKDERREKTRLIRQLSEALKKRHAEEITAAVADEGNDQQQKPGLSDLNQVPATNFIFTLPNLTNSTNEMMVD